MSLEVMSLFLFVGLLVLLVLGAEIAVAIGIVATVGLVFFAGQPIDEFGFTAFEFMNSFILSAVPLFIFMGTLLSNTGVIRSLFGAADKLMGNMPGAIACSVLGGNAIFGAISGVSLAATATFGKIAYPNMKRLGYDPKLSLGSIAVGGTLSVLIPPSIILIVYGGWVEVSVARLFAAGLIPGLMLTAMLMLTVVLRVVVNPKLAPPPPDYTWSERVRAIVDISPFLILIILMLGVIFAGIMTPTEGAALGAFLSIILTFLYRKFTFKAFKESMWEAARLMSMLAFVMVTARVLGLVFQHIGLTKTVSTFMMSLPIGKYGILIMVCLLYIVLGCFFDSITTLVLTIPFVAPIIFGLGFDPIWFGVIYVLLTEIGLVTPPFGLNLFVLHGVVPEHGIIEISLGSLPFLIPLVVCIIILTIFPQIVLWLPSVLY